MKTIGAGFSAAISAAGLSGLPFSWGDDGAIQFGPTITVDQQSAVLAVYAAYDPISDSLNEAKRLQIAALSTSCQAAIYAGFSSSALGADHTYPANDKAQTNLSGSVIDSMLPGNGPTWTTPFWCADSTGAWAYVAHTVTQIQQVGRDGKAAILSALEKNQSLATQVAAATTVAAVQAIKWI